jgi:hypothetical protein
VQHIHEGHGFGVRRREIDFVGERIRPVGALLYPGFDGLDLLRTERAGGRHLQANIVPGYPVIQKAVFAATGNHTTAAEDHASAIEAHTAALLRRSMAWHAVLPQDRHYLFCEIDSGGSLSRQHPHKRQQAHR